MKLRKKLLTLSLTFVLSVLLLAVVLPVGASPDAPDAAASLYKEANPPSGSTVMFGDVITYTVYITPSESTAMVPFYFRDDLANELKWGGFVGDHTGFGWDAATRAITGTQLMTSTAPMSVTFTTEVRALMGETGGMVVPIRNVAGLCTDPDQSVHLCFERSNVVEHETMTLYVIYLPLVTRNFSGATAR